MKTIPLLLLTSSLLLLTACRSNQETKPSVPASASSSQQASRSASTSPSSSSQTEPSSQTTTESSSAMAPQTSQAKSQPQAPSIEELYATTLHLVATDTTAGAGGGRESFVIYQDGTVETVAWHSASGQGTATLYQLAADNSGVLVLGEADFDMRATGNPNPSQFGSGRTALAFESLDWRAFD